MLNMKHNQLVSSSFEQESELNKDLKILVVDDESIYLHQFEQLILNYSKFYGMNISLDLCQTFEEATRLTSVTNYDLIFLDIDLGQGQTGIELAEHLVQDHDFTKIVFLSNRNIDSCRSETIKIDKSNFVSKPIDAGKLSQIIDSYNSEFRDLVIVVDDSKVFQDAWRLRMNEYKVMCFSNPEELLEKLDDILIRKDLIAIVLDNNFGELSDLKGIDLANIIYSKNKNIPVFLSSNEIFERGDLPKTFRAALSKSPVKAISELAEYLHINGIETKVPLI